MPIPQNLAQQFERDGAVVIPDFFTPAELAAVDAHLDHCAAQPHVSRASEFLDKTYTQTQAWSPVEQGVASFITLRDHPRLIEITGQIVGPGFENEQSLLMLTRQGHAQAWHQDTASEDPGHYIVNRLIYVRDTPAAAGALIYVPGSHRQGQIPAGGPQDPLPSQVIIEPRPGTLALVHSRCYHRVSVNQTSHPRFSINFRVRPANTPAGLTRVGVYRTTKWDFATGKPLNS